MPVLLRIRHTAQIIYFIYRYYRHINNKYLWGVQLIRERKHLFEFTLICILSLHNMVHKHLLSCSFLKRFIANSPQTDTNTPQILFIKYRKFLVVLYSWVAYGWIILLFTVESWGVASYIFTCKPQEGTLSLCSKRQHKSVLQCKGVECSMSYCQTALKSHKKHLWTIYDTKTNLRRLWSVSLNLFPRSFSPLAVTQSWLRKCFARDALKGKEISQSV